MPHVNGNSDKPDPGYDSRIGDDGVKPTGTGNTAGDYHSGLVSRQPASQRELDTNNDLGCGYGEITGKGKRD